MRNRRDRSQFRGAEKSVLDSKEVKEAGGLLIAAYAVLDKMAAKGVLHKNTASRHKAKLARYVSTLKS